MTTVNISLKDILNVASATQISFTLVGAVFTVEGSTVKPNSTKTVTTASDGTATVSLSAGNYLVQVGIARWIIGVTGTGTANLIDLIDISTPTPIQKGVPSGGTTGQILAKNSAADFDVSWFTAVLTENNFTTVLKDVYDSAVTWISTNGTNLLNHIANLANPHGVTKEQVGLGNVDNTSDSTKNSAAATLTNKTINLANNTLTGTTAQFNAALSDGDFVTLAGAETLSNKVAIGIGVATPLDLSHIKGGNITGQRLESTSDCTVQDYYSISGRTFSWRTNYNTTGFELTRSTTTGGNPTTTVVHFDTNGNMKIGGTNATEKLDVVGNIALSGNIVSAGVTAQVLIGKGQQSLSSNYSFAAAAGEEEVTGLRVTLPIINKVCRLEIIHVTYVQGATGDNDWRVRLGSDISVLTNNAVVDGKYVSGAEARETQTGVISLDLNLATQQYIFFSLYNPVAKTSAYVSASARRSNISYKIFG